MFGSCCWIFSAECSESIVTAESAAGSSLLNVQNLLLLLNATENV
jgi:hypothetical protein